MSRFQSDENTGIFLQCGRCGPGLGGSWICAGIQEPSFKNTTDLGSSERTTHYIVMTFMCCGLLFFVFCLVAFWCFEVMGSPPQSETFRSGPFRNVGCPTKYLRMRVKVKANIWALNLRRNLMEHELTIQARASTAVFHTGHTRLPSARPGCLINARLLIGINSLPYNQVCHSGIFTSLLPPDNPPQL